MPFLLQQAHETAIVLGCLAATLVGAGAVAAIAWRVWPFYRRLIRIDVGARPSDSGPRFEPLDGLRGILCLMVVVHHAIITLLLPAGRGDWGRAFKIGRPYMRLNGVAVAIFFCVTAFLFFHRAMTNVAAGKRAIEPRRFFIQRVMRVGPAVLFSGALVFVLDAFTERRFTLSNPEALGPTLMRFLTLGATGGGKDVAYNAGVMWTLGYEWMFYLVFPLLAAACAAGLSPALVIAAWIGVASISTGGLAGEGAMQALLFTPGLAAARLAESPAVARFAKSALGSIVTLLAFAFTILTARTSFSDVALLAGLLVLFPLVAAGCDLFGLLRLGALRAIGVVSFSVYLLHGLVLYLARPALAPIGSIDGPRPAAAVVAIVAVGVVAVLLSLVTYRWIEHTGIELGRRWTRSRPT